MNPPVDAEVLGGFATKGRRSDAMKLVADRCVDEEVKVSPMLRCLFDHVEIDPTQTCRSDFE